MNKKIGIIAFVLATTIGMFQPAVASAQDRDEHRGSYIKYEDRRFDNRDDRTDRFDRRDNDRRFNHDDSYRRPTRTFIDRRGR